MGHHLVKAGATHVEVVPPQIIEAIWESIKHLHGNRGAFTASDVAGSASASKGQVADYLGRLSRAGFIERTGKRDGLAPVLRARQVQAEAPKLRRDGSPMPFMQAQDQMWRAMKMMRSFSAQELAMAATTKTFEVSDAQASKYAAHLEVAGYLRSEVSARLALLYSLHQTMRTGPRAPYIIRASFVYDPNLRQVKGPAQQVKEVLK